jgi:hypothetical protein
VPQGSPGGSPEDCGAGCRCADFARHAPAGLTVAHPSAPNIVEVVVDGQRVLDLFLCCDPAGNRCRDVIAREIGLPGRDCGRANLSELARCLGVQLDIRDGYRLFITLP